MINSPSYDSSITQLKLYIDWDTIIPNPIRKQNERQTVNPILISTQSKQIEVNERERENEIDSYEMSSTESIQRPASKHRRHWRISQIRFRTKKKKNEILRTKTT